MNMFTKMMKKGQVQGPLAVALGVIFTIILVLGIGYNFTRQNASVTALNISTTAPEYTLVTYFPLFIVLIALLGIVGFLIMRSR